MKTTLNTKNWISKPFTAQGINFVSKLDPNGSIYQTVKRNKVSDEQFMAMNREAVIELWARYKRLDIVELLELVNRGAREALIELAV